MKNIVLLALLGMVTAENIKEHTEQSMLMEHNQDASDFLSLKNKLEGLINNDEDEDLDENEDESEEEDNEDDGTYEDDYYRHRHHHH